VLVLLLPLPGLDGVVADGRQTVQDVQPRHAELSEHSLALLRQQLGEREPGLEGAERSPLEVQSPALPAVVEAQHGGHQVEGDVQRHYLVGHRVASGLPVYWGC